MDSGVSALVSVDTGHQGLRSAQRLEGMMRRAVAGAVLALLVAGLLYLVRCGAVRSRPDGVPGGLCAVQPVCRV